MHLLISVSSHIPGTQVKLTGSQAAKINQLSTIKLNANYFDNRLISLSNFFYRKKSKFSDSTFLNVNILFLSLSLTVNWIYLSCGQYKTIEDIFTFLWHFIDQTTDWLIVIVINNENDYLNLKHTLKQPAHWNTLLFQVKPLCVNFYIYYIL